MAWRQRVFQCVFISFALAALMLAGYADAAEPTVTLTVDPDQREFSVKPTPQEVWIQAQTSDPKLKLTWKVSGIGEFKELGAGGIYTIPTQIEGETAAVTISVTATDAAGKTAKDRVTLTLRAAAVSTATPAPADTATPEPTPTDTPVPADTATPEPTPTDTPVPADTATPEPTPTDTPVPADTATPEPTPTDTPVPADTATPEPTPTDTPVPADTATPEPTAAPVSKTAQEIERRLADAKWHLKKKRYLTPKGRNAFEQYQAVLTLDPANEQARAGIAEILKKYQWLTENEYKHRRLKKAQQFFKLYQIVAEYAINTLGDRRLKKTRDALERQVMSAPPTPTPKPTATPQPLSCEELKREFTPAFNDFKEQRLAYQQSADLRAQAACEQKVTMLANLLDGTTRIHELLAYQRASSACFQPDARGALDSRLSMLERMIAVRAEELEAVKTQCRPILAGSCRDVEQELLRLVEQVDQEKERCQSLKKSGDPAHCSQRVTALTNLIASLQELQPFLAHQTAASGACLSAETVAQMRERIARLDEELRLYTQERAAMSAQCYASLSCEDIEQHVNLLLENIKPDVKSYERACRETLTTLSAALGDLHTIEPLLPQLQAGQCLTPDEAAELASEIPSLADTLGMFEQARLMIERRCRP